MSPTPFPTLDGLSTPNNPQAIADYLAADFLRQHPEPFAFPKDVLRIACSLEYRRLASTDRRYTANSLPYEVLPSHYAMNRPFCFLAYRCCDELLLALGTPPGEGGQLARRASSRMGGGMPLSLSLPAKAWSFPEWACAFGRPPENARREEPSADETTSLDILLDDPTDAEWMALVFVTPEPWDLLQRSLQEWRQAAERIERLHLQAGPQKDVDRVARRAKELLDEGAERFEQGLAEGLWRCSILVGSAERALSKAVLSLWCGGLSVEKGKASASDSNAALRMFSCRDAGQEDGYSVHNNSLTHRELGRLCLLPALDHFGFQRRQTARFDVDHPASRNGLHLGSIFSRELPTSHEFDLELKSLCRHLLLCGMTGSGKSTTMRNVLGGLFAQQIPFLVLEPAKAEYHVLAQSVRGLKVLKVGAAFSHRELPFLFNPFHFPEGFRLHTHIDYLKQAFVASFGLCPPAPYLLEAAIYRIYEKRGWNLANGEHPNGHQRLSFPTLGDLYEEIEPIVEEAGYSREVSLNLKGALKTRIGNLCLGPKGTALNTRENLPESVLFDSPLVLELKHLGSDEEKSLLMGLVLTRLYEYREVQGETANGDQLRHLLVIEEAHRLLKRVSEKSSDEVNMAFQAVETFANLLAEIRSYGQGVAVVEQLPSKLLADVLKNSGTKILHRMAPKEDREAMGDAMVLNEEQKREAAILACGSAIVHQEGMDNAIRIQVHPPKPPTAAASLSLPQKQLAEPFRKRIAELVERAPFARVLRHSELCAAADAQLLLPLLTPKNGFETTIAAFTADVKSNRYEATANQNAEARVRVAGWALQDALLRRALFYGWTDREYDSLHGRLVSDPSSFAAAYRHALCKAGRPLPYCKVCPSPCLFRYEASAIAEDAAFREELLNHLAENPEEGVPKALECLDQHVFMRYRCTSAPILRHCLLKEAMVRMKLNSAAINAILTSVNPIGA